MRVLYSLVVFLSTGFNKPLNVEFVRKNKVLEVKAPLYRTRYPDWKLSGKNEDNEGNEGNEGDDQFPDPVEMYASFVGFEKEEKWKSVRYTAYYFAAFSLLGDLANKIYQDMNNPFN